MANKRRLLTAAQEEVVPVAEAAALQRERRTTPYMRVRCVSCSVQLPFYGTLPRMQAFEQQHSQMARSGVQWALSHLQEAPASPPLTKAQQAAMAAMIEQPLLRRLYACLQEFKTAVRNTQLHACVHSVA